MPSALPIPPCGVVRREPPLAHEASCLAALASTVSLRFSSIQGGSSLVLAGPRGAKATRECVAFKRKMPLFVARRVRHARAMAVKKTSLVDNINKRKKAGKSRSKKRSSISKDAYQRMEEGWPKSKKATAKKKKATAKKKKATAKKKGAPPLRRERRPSRSS